MGQRGLAYERTGASADNLREAAEDLLMEMPDVPPPIGVGWGRPGNVQWFRGAKDQRKYLQLIHDLQPYRPWTASEMVAIVLFGLGVLTAAVVIGYKIRKHREETALASRHVGLDLLGAS